MWRTFRIQCVSFTTIVSLVAITPGVPSGVGFVCDKNFPCPGAGRKKVDTTGILKCLNQPIGRRGHVAHVTVLCCH